MKNSLSKCVLTAIIILAALPAQSQIYKGATFIGGSLGMRQRSERPVNIQDNGNASYFSAYINPKAGYYLANNLAIGLNLHFGFMNTEFDNQRSLYRFNENSYTSGGSAFIRYTKFIIPKLAFFTEGNIGYIHTWDKSEAKLYSTYQVDRTRANSFNISIIPGIIFMPTSRLGFEASYGNLGYSYIKSEVDRQQMQSSSAPSRNISEFGFDLSSSTLSIGFNYYFGNRPKTKVREADDE